ncbi:D-tyrosyl-tRNA deacylase [Cutibacterium acnes JCM 18918]|nr:D-tyrosyl-tRNA deacylase [Cutibacterium acnes JCM 18918]
MRVVIQRATSAEVVVEGRTVGSLTTPGLVVLVGVTGTDTATTAEKTGRESVGAAHPVRGEICQRP